jgi:hypothetical protein
MQYRTAFSYISALLFSSALLLIYNSCTTAQHSKENFRSIFNGSTLEGWMGDTTVWRVENNSIVGEVTAERPLESNTFLVLTSEEPGDFELKAEFRITEAGNSGIQYRSEQVTDIPFTLKGYQADIDGNNVYTGQNYEERGRGFLAKRGENVTVDTGKQPQLVASLGNSDSLKALIKKEGWNEIHIVAQGNRLRHYINGVLMSDVTDNDESLRKMKGVIGFQAHVGPPMKVEYRNIRLKS